MFGINLQNLKKFRVSLGPVEQAQIVVSFVVVASLITIVVLRWTSGHTLEWLLFGSVVTVGAFGFIIVTVTLKYGRLFEEQKQELLALNAFTESMNRSVTIQFLLQNALYEVQRLLDIEYGWIFRTDGNTLSLSAQRGTEELDRSVLDSSIDLSDQRFAWVFNPKIVKRKNASKKNSAELWQYGMIGSWASTPILMKDQFSGVMVAASKKRNAFSHKQVELMTAFANQLGIAMENAALFDRLVKSEERYADLFEHSPDMSHIVNQDGVIVSCNQTEAARLGYLKEDLVGQSILKLYPKEYHNSINKMLQDIFKHHFEIKDLEEKFITANGDPVDVSIKASLIPDEQGEPMLMRAVARDITEKKKMEAKIIHAQRIDSIGNLAGGIAHDFNNILTSILGSTAIMRRKIKHESEWYHFVEIIETAAKRGASLTRQLLTFARKSTAHFRPIIANDIIQETLHLFGRSIDKTISIKTNFSADTYIINGDDGQIQQALLNLLINARDAMADGGVVTITTSKIAVQKETLKTGDHREGNYIAISIADTGTGMDTETLQHIFEPFFTTKNQGKGTGLGLSVVYGVVNAHNGFITVNSQSGIGSEFIVNLPLHPVTETFRRPLRKQKLMHGNERILIVDDEKDVAGVIAEMLESIGYRVTAVHSGLTAIDLFKKKKRFDALILDLNMPRMSGQETFFKLKEIDPQVRVIIATGYSNRIIDTSPLRDHANALLQKPFQIEELSKTLRTVLDEGKN